MVNSEKANSGGCCPAETASNNAGCQCAQTSPPGAAALKTVLDIKKVSATLSRNDKWGAVKCRLSSFRNNYTVNPGLYAVGEPSEDSDVFVSANYKLSFDKLRSALAGINTWVLVLDTKGINVWCAAGKGTFSTEELIKKISDTNLPLCVRHRRLIVPQLGAVGISAYKVVKATGFKVLFGPVYAADIAAYIKNGYKATAQMRAIHFPMADRLVLTPMEIIPMLKWYPVYAAAVLIFFGAHSTGIVFRDAFYGGAPFLLLGLVAVLAGAFITPAFLPVIPFRAFSLKGWIAGLLAMVLVMKLISAMPVSLMVFTWLFFPAVSSFAALQFTGSTTFTGMSGVKKELRYAVFGYVIAGAASLISLILYKSGVL
ncbi:MAG: acetyl-CoA synthase subunit gamma [Nitrospirae bacterium]|nr:acetyl-CoA synthase subunit gamma [Nitrospirota bacterium]